MSKGDDLDDEFIIIRNCDKVVGHLDDTPIPQMFHTGRLLSDTMPSSVTEKNLGLTFEIIFLESAAHLPFTC